MDTEFSEWVQARGFAPDDLTDEQRTSLQALWRREQRAEERRERAAVPAFTAAADPAAADAPAAPARETPAERQMEEILAAQRQENRRREAIVALVAQYLQGDPGSVDKYESVGRMAIDGKWTLQQTELALLRMSRGQGPTVYASAAQSVTPEVLEAAVAKTCGLPNLDKEYKDRTLSAADKFFRNGIGLQQLLEHTARQNGYRDASVRGDMRGTLKAAFRDPVDGDGRFASVGGPSSSSLSGVLAAVANKFSRDAFLRVEAEWRQITAVRSVPNFQQITTYSLTGNMTYELVPPGGEVKHATVGQETYTNKAETYAKLLAVDRQDIINDDFGAFARVNQYLGRGAALKINDVFWREFMDNSAFFTTGNGNFDAGTDTALGVAGLTVAYDFWLKMTDPDGNPMGHMARYLLVPPGLWIEAQRLMNSQEITLASSGGPNTVTITERASTNPFRGMFIPVVSRYLANASYTGNSNLAWYLIADPADIPVIETVFLNGREMPMIESAEMEMDRLGIVLRGVHDFGVKKQEPRGGFKFKGEA